MDGIFVADGEARVEPVAVAGLLEAGLVLGSPTVALAGRGLEVVEEDVSVRDVFNFSVLVVFRPPFFSVRDLEVAALLVDVLFVVFELLAGSLLELAGLGCFPLATFSVFFTSASAFSSGGGRTRKLKQNY